MAALCSTYVLFSAPRGLRVTIGPGEICQTVCKPGSVPAPKARPVGRWTVIHLGRPSPDASRDLPGRSAQKHACHGEPWRAAPIRSCSRWGLPCHRRYRRRGALLPHPFTLTRLPRPKSWETGGLLSVALSLGSPPPGVTRPRIPAEPGLSSPAPLLAKMGSGDRPAV